jgi:hypothetical protein
MNPEDMMKLKTIEKEKKAKGNGGKGGQIIDFVTELYGRLQRIVEPRQEQQNHEQPQQVHQVPQPGASDGNTNITYIIHGNATIDARVFPNVRSIHASPSEEPNFEEPSFEQPMMPPNDDALVAARQMFDLDSILKSKISDFTRFKEQ